ncbi:hypothetical protein ACFWIB_30960 [Streptomyces sp. NPDC127051]|uniref:hypothetical protein n=1 Tax=Streptomyces sp. NPDC127051 TaxID=3347119 RepID=UPI0036566474
MLLLDADSSAKDEETRVALGATVAVLVDAMRRATDATEPPPRGKRVPRPPTPRPRPAPVGPVEHTPHGGCLDPA